MLVEPGVWHVMHVNCAGLLVFVWHWMHETWCGPLLIGKYDWWLKFEFQVVVVWQN